jgi:hypothetical protein
MSFHCTVSLPVSLRYLGITFEGYEEFLSFTFFRVNNSFGVSRVFTTILEVYEATKWRGKRTGELIPKEYKRNTVNMNTISGFVLE